MGNTCLLIVNVGGKLKLVRFEGNSSYVTLSSDGTFLFNGSWKGQVHMLDVESGKEMKRFEGYPYVPITALSVSFISWLFWRSCNSNGDLQTGKEI